MATYAPGVPADPDCQASGSCQVGAFGDVAYMILHDFGVIFWIASLSAGQPECSIFNRIDLFEP